MKEFIDGMELTFIDDIDELETEFKRIGIATQVYKDLAILMHSTTCKGLNMNITINSDLPEDKKQMMYNVETWSYSPACFKELKNFNEFEIKTIIKEDK